MPSKLQLVGLRFGRLIVNSENGRDAFGAVIWRCTCDCGKTTLVRGSSLRSGVTASCGCGISLAAAKPKTHGMTNSPIYKRWQSMKARCNQPNHKHYENYGGRGIRVCARWNDSFENFLADMGASFKPELEIDRKNNDGNYEPGNCQWISHGVQQRNKRNNHNLTINGTTRTVAEWAEKTGLKANTILTRSRRGWPEHKLLKIANA